MVSSSSGPGSGGPAHEMPRVAVAARTTETEPEAQARAGRDPVRGRRLEFAAAALVTAVPHVVAVGTALRGDWIPVNDSPRLAVTAVDIWRGDPALLGAPSTSLEQLSGIRPVNHFGPAVSYVLAPFVGITAQPWGLLVGILVITLTTSLVALAAARALAGRGGVAAMAVALVAVTASLGTPVLADVWNPFVPLVPLVAAITCVWVALLAGWRPGLLWSVVLGSLAVQSHVTHLPVLAAAVIPVLVLIAIGVRRGGRSSCDLPRRRTVIMAAAFGLVMWTPPALSELTAGSSNIANLLRASTADTTSGPLGAGYALRLLGGVLLPPVPFGPEPVVFPVWLVDRGVTATTVMAGLGIAGAVAALVASAHARGDRVVAGIGMSLAASLLAAVVLMSQSTGLTGAGVYQTRWLWSLSALLWWAVAVGIGRQVAPAAFAIAGGAGGPLPGRRVAGPRLVAPVVLIVVAALTAAIRVPMAPVDRIAPEMVAHPDRERARRRGRVPIWSKRALGRSAPARVGSRPGPCHRPGRASDRAGLRRAARCLRRRDARLPRRIPRCADRRRSHRPAHDVRRASARRGLR